MQQREVGSNYQHWVSKLMGFNFDITYKPGVSNRVADALSRKDEGEVSLGALISSSVVDWTEVQKEADNDPFISRLKAEISSGKKEVVGFTVHDGKLVYKQ